MYGTIVVLSVVVYGEKEFHLLIEEMKRKDVLYEEDSVLKLRHYFGFCACYKQLKMKRKFYNCSQRAHGVP